MHSGSQSSRAAHRCAWHGRWRRESCGLRAAAQQAACHLGNDNKVQLHMAWAYHGKPFPQRGARGAGLAQVTWKAQHVAGTTSSSSSGKQGGGRAHRGWPQANVCAPPMPCAGVGSPASAPPRSAPLWPAARQWGARCSQQLERAAAACESVSLALLSAGCNVCPEPQGTAARPRFNSDPHSTHLDAWVSICQTGQHGHAARDDAAVQVGGQARLAQRTQQRGSRILLHKGSMRGCDVAAVKTSRRRVCCTEASTWWQ